MVRHSRRRSTHRRKIGGKHRGLGERRRSTRTRRGGSNVTNLAYTGGRRRTRTRMGGIIPVRAE